jgi:hypothetical protein
LSENASYFVSVEGILQHFAEPDLGLFASRLSRYAPKDTQLVISIRELGSFFDSAYQQVVKADFLESPLEYFSAVGPKRRHKLRRMSVLGLVKYDLDSLVTALLGKFESVVLIDARQEAYLPWLSKQIGTSVERIREVSTNAPKALRDSNESLSGSSVRMLQQFNFLARHFFMLVGINSIAQAGEMSIKGRPTVEVIKRKLTYAVTRLKSKLIGLLRLVDSKRSGAKKYQLPTELREEILSQVPASNLYAQVQENGGVLKVTRESTF